MPVTDVSKYDFLRKEFTDRMVDDFVLPKLIFDNMGPHVVADAPSIVYLQRQYSAATDPLALAPPVQTQLGEFASLTFSELDWARKALRSWGAKLVWPPNLKTYTNQAALQDEIARTRQDFIDWFSLFINNWVARDITNNWSTTTTSDTTMAGIIDHESDVGYESTLGHVLVTHDTSNYGWSTGAANPLKDLIQWRTAFNSQEPTAGQRYNYRLTDIFLDEVEFGDLLEYLTFANAAKWQIDPTNGTLSIASVGGVRIHELEAAFYDTNMNKKSGFALLIDRNASPYTIYEAYTAGYPKTAKYFNSHQYDSDDTHETTYQLWCTRVAVLRRPKAFGVVTGLN